jgi:hypothetical protein
MRVVIIFWLIILYQAMNGWVYAQTRIHIPEPYADSFIESELITEASILPLQIDRYGIIMPDMEMRVDNNEYFILDNRTSQCVYRFDSNGELLNTICEEKLKSTTNNSPDLSNPVKFSIDPYRNHVEIYNFENSSVTRFRYDGKANGKIKFSINPADYIRNNKGDYWIYSGWNNSETQYRLLKADHSGNITDRRLRLPTRCTPTEGFAFHAFNNKILFWESLGSNLYLIDENEVKPQYQFDFGNYNLPRDYHLTDAKESFPLINQAGYYSIKKYLENNDFAYFFLNFNSNDRREMFHVIHDKKNNQVHIYTENSGIAAFDKAQALTEKNELIFLVAPRRLRQLMSNDFDYVPVVFADIMEGLQPLRNPVVLKLKLETLSNRSIEQEYEYNEQYYFED